MYDHNDAILSFIEISDLTNQTYQHHGDLSAPFKTYFGQMSVHRPT